MKRSFLFASILAATSLATAAQTASQPRIVVVISVDQFSADLFSEYRPLFTAGLKRLQGGAVFPSGYQSHADTETCPGHSTILTGSHPARTGIIANEWYDQSLSRADKKVYCAEDPSISGSSSTRYTVSAKYLKSQTLGDRMKTVNAQSRVVSVAGKDRAAIMMGGHTIDEAWFWGGKAFVTLGDVTKIPPRMIEKVNAAVSAGIAKPEFPALPAACRAHSMSVAVADKEVGILREHKAGDAAGFRTSLAFDRATTDIAIGLLRELKLGEGPAPDLLAIGLSATDYVGHIFGTEGAEMCAQVLGVDENVGRILAALDATHQPYVVVLTADHGGHDLPERNQLRAIADAVRVDPALMPSNVSRQLAAEFNLKEPVLVGVAPFGDIYLGREVPAELRARVLESARARYLAHPHVAAVFTATELHRMSIPSGPPDEWSLAERFRASFDPERSGDLLVALKPHVTPITDAKVYVATHGSPWNYDRRVPVLFYRPGLSAFEQPLPIDTVDILPTLAALIGLPIPPAEIDGHCIDLDAGSGTTCTP
ncbi:MAG: alkaline phosphatase family protein [Pseudomonadota bacterium]|nr:alkaline phosphatase family protein [Pseudomonadota bacterium]